MAVSTLVISAVTGYRSLCISAWGYGLGLGGYRYSLKMFALERVRAKHFTKAWGKLNCSNIYYYENARPTSLPGFVLHLLVVVPIYDNYTIRII